jgi:hypothetical protein
MVYGANQLNAQLPDDLQARVEEGVAVAEQGDARRVVYPDVQVVEESHAAVAKPAGTNAVIDVAEPYLVQVEEQGFRQRHLQIVELSGQGRVITVVEFLSPANKVGLAGPQAYLRKQREYLEGGLNLVEVDLIRVGKFVLAVPEERLPAACRTPYLACVRRTTRRWQAEVYPLPLRQRLPNLPVPLRADDKDAVLQLQVLLDDCYRDGRYQRLDYRAELTPPLEADDAGWADALLRERGLR